MDLDKFYSDNPIQVWEKVLGEKMHYHFSDDSNPNEDPFDQTVINIFPFIKPNSKVLDCGCGWGGPAKLLIEKLNCDVTGVTSSKGQFEYIKSFPVIHSDMHDFIPTQIYDTALFMQSVTCMEDMNKIISNIKDHVNSVVIVDYLHLGSKTLYTSEWGQYVRCKKDFVDPLESNGYTVKHFSQRKNFFQPAIDYWIYNIENLDKDLVVDQIAVLYDFCLKCKSNVWSQVDLCTIYATK